MPIYCLFEPMNVVKNNESIASTSASTSSDVSVNVTSDTTGANNNAAKGQTPVPATSKTNIKLRLSHTNRDLKLPISKTDSILLCKKKLQVC